MNAFRFAHSEYLYLLFLLIPLAGIILLDYFLRKKAMEKFAEEKLHSLLAPYKSRMKFIVKSALVFLSVTLLIFAFANPQIGTKVEEVKQVGIDVYVLLDVSRSMAAEDIKPSRLAKAKHDIKNLIRKLRGDRIGLIVFAGKAYVQFPLTTDYSAANMFLSAVDFDSVPQQGTNIGAAIKLALRSFKKDNGTQKAIILITDGEDHEGDVEAALKEANEKGVSIYTIGLGSPEGVPIPVYDATGKQIGYKKDRYGKVVLTKLDVKTLEEIAEKGNGKYYFGQSNMNELEEIYKDLSKLQKTEFGSKKITDYEDRFYLALFPAVLLLVIEFFITRNKFRFIRKIETEGEPE
jgi:Ca-activated chloride channel family protein